MNEELKNINPLYVADEIYEVGKVNGICFNIIELLRKKDFDEQMLIYSMILENDLGKNNG